MVAKTSKLHKHRAEMLLLLCSIFSQSLRCPVHSSTMQPTAGFLLNSDQNPPPKMASATSGRRDLITLDQSFQHHHYL
ncbi:unnamed protein product [Strongylus vulgaris]|uniref:Secreted protein n=1 Tax=Strongylus vulgaris TaxID=40348 RepID=A0A3P7I194_STRVU|nr:unnamed protein product [Strongylus vulgaris]